MNIENKNQLTAPNILFGFFDFIFLIFRNIKLFLIFFIITLFINLFIFFIYDYKSFNFGLIFSEDKYSLNTQVRINLPANDVPINFLENELINLQKLINEKSTEKAILDTFNLVYSLDNFFHLLSNEDIIHEVLIDQGIIDNNTDQNTINNLIFGYSNRFNNEYIKDVSGKIGIDIKFELNNINSDKIFIKKLIIKSNEKVSEQFFINLTIILNKLSNKIKRLKQNPINQLKAKQQLEMNNQDIKSLKLHYKTALNLNIIKPKILTTGEAYQSFSHPLFFNLGTEILSELIKSTEDQLISDLVFKNKQKLINIQLAEDNLNELIEIVGINNQHRFSIIHFNNNIVKTKVEESTSTKEINYLLYLFVLFLGLLSFISTILIIENYKKYKLN